MSKYKYIATRVCNEIEKRSLWDQTIDYDYLRSFVFDMKLGQVKPEWRMSVTTFDRLLKYMIAKGLLTRIKRHHYKFNRKEATWLNSN